MGFTSGAAFWRKAAWAGSRYGPRLWLELSPGPIGLSFAIASPAARRNVQHALREICPEDGPALIRWRTTRTFVEYAHCLAESLASGRRESQRARCRPHEPKQVEALRATGGVVVVTAHAGAWDAAAPLLARDFDRPVTVVMRREANQSAGSFHDGVRTRGGVQIVHVGEHPTDSLPLLGALRRGSAVAFQLDRQPPNARTLAVDVVGTTWSFPEGPFRLAALGGVPLLPVFVRRVGSFDYELWGGPPLRLPRHPSARELHGAAQAVAWELGRFLRAHPEQWFCFEPPAAAR